MDTKHLPTFEEVLTLFESFSEIVADEDKEVVRYTLSSEPTTSLQISALDELMALTGMEEVKEAVLSQINYHKIMQMRHAAGRKTPQRLPHMLLTGNPGTGKTTVARLIGKIYKEEGILKSGHLVEVNRAALVGKWIGETEEKTTQYLKDAKGGILFIDEMYSLIETNEPSGRDFGLKVIDTLMPVLSDSNSDIMVIGAGYSDSMRAFLAGNPGLASRFPNVLDFKDFTIDELIGIAFKELEKNDFVLAEEAYLEMQELLKKAVKVKDFGNARLVKTMINNFMIPRMCNRLAKMGNLKEIDIDQTSLIKLDDMPSFDELFPLHGKQRRSVGFGR